MSSYYDCAMPIKHPAAFTLFAGIATLLFAATGQSQTATPSPSLKAFRAQFESLLQQHGVVGGGFALVRRKGQPQILAFGEARRETHQQIDDATAYNWASITKTMTAIAILQLRDRGKLSLDDPAVRYVPELREVHDPYGAIDTITIRHMLTHSAGFRNPT
jgi:CubicO group peptidase (beta-lactamase class C family)